MNRQQAHYGAPNAWAKRPESEMKVQVKKVKSLRDAINTTSLHAHLEESDFVIEVEYDCGYLPLENSQS